MILTTVIVIIGALTIGLSLFAVNNQVEETIVDPKPMDEVSYEQYTIDLFMIGSVDNVNIDTLKPICHSFDISLYVLWLFSKLTNNSISILKNAKYGTCCSSKYFLTISLEILSTLILSG